LNRELGETPDWDYTTRLLTKNYEAVLGPLTPGTLSQAVLDTMETLRETHTTEDWLTDRKRPARAGRRVKVSTTASVVRNVYKARGGLIRATMEISDDRLSAIELSGDFFFYPSDGVAKLEERLTGLALADVPEAVRAFYAEGLFDSPGITPDDLITALSPGAK